MARVIGRMTEEERHQFARLIGDFATRAVLVPVPERGAFVKEAVARVREMYRQRYRANAETLVETVEFVDQMERYIQETVELLESEGGSENSP